jgi:type VI protein secretion system component VasF
MAASAESAEGSSIAAPGTQDRFPDWARVLIAIVLAVAAYLASSQTALDDQTRGALATAIALVSATGVVPPLPQTLKMPQSVSVVLTILVGVVTYVLNVSVSMDADLRGVILAILSVLAAVGIRPPQVAK